MEEESGCWSRDLGSVTLCAAIARHLVVVNEVRAFEPVVQHDTVRLDYPADSVVVPAAGAHPAQQDPQVRRFRIVGEVE